MAEHQQEEMKMVGAGALPHDPETTPPAQDAAKQITKENVTKLNKTNDNTADQNGDGLSSPAGQASEPSDTFAVRGSSSAFLASLTSASDVSSPLTSAFPSTDSLQSTELVQEDKDGIFGSLQRGSMIEMAMPINLHRSVPAQQTDSSPAEHPSHTASESSELHTENSSPTEYQYKTPTNHDRIIHDLETKTPSRTHTPSQSALSTPGEHARMDSQIIGHEYYSSGKYDEEYEQSHSKTPLIHPSDYPAPKETGQAIKDYSIMGNKLINQYETIHKLGTGAHGTVKLGRDLDNGKYVAIKIVRRYPKKARLGKQQQSPEEKVKKEIAVLKKAQHPHVVSLLEVIDDQSIEKVYLVLEYVERGEIKWRKKTDRDVANFEMQRMKREIAGNVDEAAETEHLLNFNDYLYQQQLERANNKSVTNSSASEGYHDEHIWDERSRHPFPSRHSSRPSSRPASRPPSELDISATHTLRVPSRASSQRDAYSYEAEFNDSMYNSYVEDESITHASVFERERWLKDEPTVDQQWSPEEEEYRFVPCLTLSEARDVFRDTVLGLEYLHYHNIIHRDIKPANLLWTKDYRVKISDFGVSYLGRPLEDEEGDQSQKSGADVSIELAKTVGTPAFYAPELCDPDLFDPEKDIRRPHISGQIDVWALGITLYAMIYGRLPFFDQNEFSMYEKIARQEVVIPSKRLRGVDFDAHDTVTNSNKREEHVVMYEDVDDELRDLVRRLLHKDPSKRITIKEVKHHPWLLRGMDDPALWIRVTDPAWKGDKIEVSQADLQKAVVPRTLLGKVWETMTNITKGRVPSRRRAETSSKHQIKRVSSSLSRSNTLSRGQRRESLKADESTILNVLRATRDLSDHPLSKSTVATPKDERRDDFFPPVQQVDSQGNPVRPSARTVTTADSILTVKAQPREEFEAFGVNRHVPGPDSVGSSSSSLAKILDNTKEATRRLASRVRSRDSHGSRSDDAGIASRTASGENIALTPEGRSLKPSLAVSTALAAGHVELPPSLHSESATSSPQISPPTSSGTPSTDSLQNFERGRSARQRASTASNASWGYVSPGFEEIHRARLASLASSGGQSLPSKSQYLPLTNSSPWSQPKYFAEAMHSTPAYAATSDAGASLLTTGETITPEMMKQKQEERGARGKLNNEQMQARQDGFHQAQQDEHKRDSNTKKEKNDSKDDDDYEGSDDEGITFGSKK